MSAPETAAVTGMNTALNGSVRDCHTVSYSLSVLAVQGAELVSNAV